MKRLANPVAALLLVIAASPARAQLPSTITPDLFPFPGGYPSPGSASSAGLALADRWLGDEPFDNPAGSRPWTLTVTPLLYHVSRQDLRADHRGYEETSAFFDGAAASLSMEMGRLGLSLYGHQPVARFEDNLFQTGPITAPTGTAQSNSSTRELRGGLALSYGSPSARFGVAGEWTHRVDHYERIEDTGGPAPATYVTDFSGDAPGGQAGFRLGFGEGPGALTVGGAVRYVADLDLTGDETLSGASGSTTTAISTRREAGFEGGFSLGYAVTDAFRALAAAGIRSEQNYEGWGVLAGRGSEWKLAGEYHDARDPWTVRFGFGQERQNDVPEERAGVFSLGAGIRMETTVIDFGIVHRSLKRADHPSFPEDRLVLTLVQRF